MTKSILSSWLSYIVIYIIVVFPNSCFAAIYRPVTNSFWNHIHQGAYQVVNSKKRTLLSEDYDAKFVNDDKVRMRLLRKLIANHQQHVNGVEFKFVSDQLTFGNVFSISFNVELLATSKLPDINWPAPYKQYETQLLNQQHHFALILFGKNHNNSDKSTIYAEIRFSLTPDEITTHESNKTEWLIYQQKNWQNTPLVNSALNQESIVGAILVAETAGYTTLENLSEHKPILEEKYIQSDLIFSELRLHSKY